MRASLERRRAGRRPGQASSREDILLAAQVCFAAHGYEGATVREIARYARVDASLIHYFFGSKRGVFAAAVSNAVCPPEIGPAVVSGGPDGLAERILRSFLSHWETSGNCYPMLAIIRSAVSHDEAAAQLGEFITTEVLGILVNFMPPRNARVRATLVGAQLIGLIMVRYIIKLEPIASADAEALVRLIAPVIQRYLATDLP